MAWCYQWPCLVFTGRGLGAQMGQTVGTGLTRVLLLSAQHAALTGEYKLIFAAFQGDESNMPNNNGGGQDATPVPEIMLTFNLSALSDRLCGFIMTVQALSIDGAMKLVSGSDLKAAIAKSYPPLRLFTNEFLTILIMYKALVEWPSARGCKIVTTFGKPSSRVLA